ncbi:WS/DGAT/MGAT family O-acyltransferase [Mycolicibacterium pallens]|uniref:Diacylglycerol O-acyltransferase n=1 Tax=Mycolicibacterium pallens TaxID=370524 RepID=A0ABX8VFP4_9MYCO|nr:wax ester/triacylglycerol synthase family O-acyltransferase [Mycolicibacterium pallens]APE17907.1 diacylglycerol O-acyltransferase [Mycobacterium sp. WY10]QYL16629.1 wax ester/triacylglycerol synthase family O-acyltransferase [Mycolicibacterium pallens]
MELISPTDSMFLLAESREHPMHVGGLQLFEPPDDMGPEFLAEIYNDLLTYQDVQPTFRKHPGALFGGIANLTWAFDRDIDLEYHLRRSALPKPGRVRELLELTSRLHGSLLDRHRPLWETHLVEGLNDGRVAVYTKIHHSLLDGVSAMKLTKRTLSPDPQDEEIRAPWTIGPRARNKEKSGGGSPLGGLVRAAGSVAGLAPSALTIVRGALFEQQLTLPFEAPKTMFNVPIGGARRVAAQSWPLKRIIAIKEAAAGVTVNDVILAMCAGALRAYLIEQDALPDKPLIAMVPVNLRDDNDPSSGGNQVGAILCSLATDQSDPAKRLEAIHDSISGNKEVFLQLPKMQQLALSAFNMAPLALTLLPALAAAAAPPFNIVISNVPGAREPLYWHGARLDGNYPLSIALDGQALNITMSNNADNLDFGLVGCRRSIPHLQRLLTQLEDSLAALEKAVGV